jgi:hypothetical protein
VLQNLAEKPLRGEGSQEQIGSDGGNSVLNAHSFSAIVEIRKRKSGRVNVTFLVPLF